ncbi:hypothetical protein H0H81_008620 [Sphagnurus paluster]|uniref:PPM-type phosphatase domain-containing protein n=1 Tax=Sphagnurus paluster TaxID=117069 RepID=A0A9P7FQ51_9AGAR|nr:hypothetical protein H0H81_008620 [Sphagnurus paluster]
MYRPQAALRQYASLWSRRLYTRRKAGAFVLGAAALGTLYDWRHVIYADNSQRNPQAGSNGSSPEDDEQFIKTRLPALSNTIIGDVGILQFDEISVPRLVWIIAEICEVFMTLFSVSAKQDASLCESIRPTRASTTAWTFLTLYDGYDGWQNINAVLNQLLSALRSSLLEVLNNYEPSNEHTEVGMGLDLPDGELEPYDDAINRKIKDVFLEVDDNIVHKPFNFTSGPYSRSSIATALGPAIYGSSAMVAFYDTEHRTLRVAHTGNIRAVLGRRCMIAGRSSYEVHVLTSDHTCSNPAEAARLRAQHPGEVLCSGDNMLLGCGLSRAFGMAAFKWGREMQERLHREFLGDTPLMHVKTPPYLSAEPDITTVEVQPGDFLVMATSGLWKSLTNEEAVGLVGMWLDKGLLSTPVTPPSGDAISPQDLPVVLGKDDTVNYARWDSKKEFLCVDPNAAMHLARNALGGANLGLTAGLLAILPPRAEKFRFLGLSPLALLRY